MKSLKLLSFIAVGFVFNATAQTFAPQEVKNIHKCAADEIHQEKMQSDAVYRQNTLNFDKEYLKQLALKTANVQTTQVGATYIIPVVVHVMHKGEAPVLCG